MYTPRLIEKVGASQQSDRLKEAELARLFRVGQASSTAKLKLTVLLSGAVLIALTVVQLL
jgi:hypothetical protein